jgi:hypothetical protein
LALSALSLSHPAIKNLLARSLLSMWSFWGLYFLTRNLQGKGEAELLIDRAQSSRSGKWEIKAAKRKVNK